jgi:hypothetical protein
MEFIHILFLVLFILVGLKLFVFPYYTGEGFQSGMPGVRCGVDLPICRVGLQCMNGFCSSPSQPLLLQNQLPVYP